MSGRPGTRLAGSPPAPARTIAAVHRVSESTEDEARYVRLNRNERLGPLPEWFVDQVRVSLSSDLLTGYPVAEPLHRRLAASLDVTEEQVLLTPSSDAAIKALFHAYVEPGDAVVMLDPSYAMYAVYAQMFGATCRKACFERSGKLDLDALSDLVAPGVRLVMLANPNQPTGTLLPEDAVLALAVRAAEVGALVAVDEAYFEYAGQTVLPLAAERPNVVVVRTFSKAAGLAGLRIGYVAGPAAVVDAVSRVRTVHDVNSVALLCAELVLAHPEVASDYVGEVKAGAALLAERALALGLTPRPVATNFMVIEVAHRCEPAALVERLLDRGYLIKGPFRARCLEDCVRVTLGPPELMAEFAAELEQVLAD